MPILGRSLRMGCYLTRLHLQSVGLAGRALVILGMYMVNMLKMLGLTTSVLVASVTHYYLCSQFWK